MDLAVCGSTLSMSIGICPCVVVYWACRMITVLIQGSSNY